MIKLVTISDDEWVSSFATCWVRCHEGRGMSHLRSARIESDVIEERLNLVLWNCWGRPNPGVPRIIELPGRLSVQDHTRGHLLDDGAPLSVCYILTFPSRWHFRVSQGTDDEEHFQEDPPHQLFSTLAPLSYLLLGQKQLLDSVTSINSGRSRSSMCPILPPHHCLSLSLFGKHSVLLGGIAHVCIQGADGAPSAP